MDVVAQKVGFTTTSTFNRNFKKYLNTSPYQWKISPENYERKLLNYNISAVEGLGKQMGKNAMFCVEIQMQNAHFFSVKNGR